MKDARVLDWAETQNLATLRHFHDAGVAVALREFDL
jgi:hypothetical protein